MDSVVGEKPKLFFAGKTRSMYVREWKQYANTAVYIRQRGCTRSIKPMRLYYLLVVFGKDLSRKAENTWEPAEPPALSHAPSKPR